MGTSFTGSTLLSFLLDSLPDVASVGEPTGPLDAPDNGAVECSCHRRLDSCPFWEQVSAEMRRRGHEFGPYEWDTRFRLSDNRLVQHAVIWPLHNLRLDAARDGMVRHLPHFGPRIRRIGARHAALAESILAVTGKSVFVDASKDPRTPVLLRDLVGIEAAVIHLTRDAPGYVLSAIRNEGQTVDSAVRSWVNMADHVERLRRRWPAEKWLRLRYEDLATNAGAAVAMITEFLGTSIGDWTPELSKGPGHHIIGNQMALSDRTSIEVDARWQSELDATTVSIIERRTEEWRRKFGYAGVAP